MGFAGAGLAGLGVGEEVGSAGTGLFTGVVGTGEGVGPVIMGVTAAHKAQLQCVVQHSSLATTPARCSAYLAWVQVSHPMSQCEMTLSKPTAVHAILLSQPAL